MAKKNTFCFAVGVSPVRSQTCLEEKVPGRTVLLPLLPFLFSTDSGRGGLASAGGLAVSCGVCVRGTGCAGLAPVSIWSRVASTAGGLPT